jgi:DNA-binding transcriptional LysR family regulator
MTPAISHAFARFTALHPEIRLDVTTGLSRDLARRFRGGELDVVAVKEPHAKADARASFREPLVWLEAAGPREPWGDPLPLVTFPPGGLYRDQMIEQIEAAGLRWYLAFTGNSLASVLRAVEAGLGIALLPSATMGDYRVQLCPRFGPVPPMALSVYAWEQEAAADALVSAMTAILARDRSAAEPAAVVQQHATPGA